VIPLPILVAAVRHASGGEWIDAAAVHRVLVAEQMQVTREKVARALPAPARAGHYELHDDGVSKRYRAQVSAVVVYDADGIEAGRLLLWRTTTGVEMDFSQLVEALPARGWTIDLADRDVRRVRAACDDALWHVGRR
jgi:hypothetical protein